MVVLEDDKDDAPCSEMLQLAQLPGSDYYEKPSVYMSHKPSISQVARSDSEMLQLTYLSGSGDYEKPSASPSHKPFISQDRIKTIRAAAMNAATRSGGPVAISPGIDSWDTPSRDMPQSYFFPSGQNIAAIFAG